MAAMTLLSTPKLGSVPPMMGNAKMPMSNVMNTMASAKTMPSMPSEKQMSCTQCADMMGPKSGNMK